MEEETDCSHDSAHGHGAAAGVAESGDGEHFGQMKSESRDTQVEHPTPTFVLAPFYPVCARALILRLSCPNRSAKVGRGIFLLLCQKIMITTRVRYENENNESCFPRPNLFSHFAVKMGHRANSAVGKTANPAHSVFLVSKRLSLLTNIRTAVSGGCETTLRGSE